jgi:hypothetical protein
LHSATISVKAPAQAKRTLRVNDSRGIQIQPLGVAMVKSDKQAKRIQAKREASGKRGIAKAVRRFNKR